MFEQKISENLKFYRNKHNLTTDQVANIAGVTTEEYEKMELGLAEVSYEVLGKLSKFYNIDISSFTSEAVEVVRENKKQEKPEKEVVVEEKKKFPVYGTIFNIIGLVVAVGLFVLLLVVAFNGALLFANADNWDDFFRILILGPFVVLFWLLQFVYVIWELVASIMHVVSKKLNMGKFGKVSKILSIIFGFLAFLLAGFITLASEGTPVAVIYVSAIIFEIIINIVKVTARPKIVK